MWHKLQQLQLLKDKLDKNKKIFFAELIGTFTVIVFATSSVVLDTKLNGALGLPFIAIAPAIAVAMGVYIFGKTTMAHFNYKTPRKKKRIIVDLSLSRNFRWHLSQYIHLLYSWKCG